MKNDHDTVRLTAAMAKAREAARKRREAASPGTKPVEGDDGAGYVSSRIIPQRKPK
jgi:hypothetical protein